MTIRLRILVFEEPPGVWIARALEHDVLAEGHTIESAVQAILRVIRAHIEFDRRHNREPLSGFRAAPQVYWNAFSRAKPLDWVSAVAQALPIPAEITAAVAEERPRRSENGEAMDQPARLFRMLKNDFPRSSSGVSPVMPMASRSVIALQFTARKK
jgi:hypothetical protein